jgi:hypothetical protein
MARQTLNRGSAANDGTGDTLRIAAQKINENFSELYTSIGGDSATTSVTLTAIGAVFEGSIADGHETNLIAVNPTGDRDVYIPNASGTIVLDSDTQTLTNKTILVPIMTTPKIRDANASHTYNVTVGDISANRNIALPVLGAGDTFVFENHTQTLTNKTLTSPSLVNIKLGGLSGGSLLLDSSSNEYLKFVKTASAVNFVTVTNSATGNAAAIDVDGGDTNISLKIGAKGTGAVQIVNKLVLEKGTDVATTTAVDLSEPLTVFNSGSLILPTIGDGTIQAEVKHFSNVGAGEVRLQAGSTTKIFGCNNNGYVSFGEGDGCILVWNSTKSKWFFVSNNGTTIVNP